MKNLSYLVTHHYIVKLYRWTCGIALEDTVIITGGSNSYGSVIAIDQYGSETNLPDLNTGRRAHGCGYYTNENDETVLSMNKIFFVNIQSFRSCWLLLGILKL